MEKLFSHKRLNHRLLHNIIIYVVVAGLLSTALGFLERYDGQRVHWLVFYGSFLIFFVIIDIPIVILAIWLKDQIADAIAQTVDETLRQTLPVIARMFIEHYKEQQDEGNLPDPQHVHDVEVPRTSPPHRPDNSAVKRQESFEKP